MSKSEYVKSWRKRTKQRIVDSMGGKCSECGYNKCLDALELHHINPETKEFSLGGMRARPKSWSIVVEELKKCVLLCANCHREVEAGIRHLSNPVSTFDDSYVEYTIGKFKYSEKNFKYDLICVRCDTPFKGFRKTTKYCSHKCRTLR